MRLAIIVLYCGDSGKKGYYNRQEVGLAKAFSKLGYEVYIFYPSNNQIIASEKSDAGLNVIYYSATFLGNHAHSNWKFLLDYKIDVAQVNADNQLFAPNLLKFCRANGIKSYCYIGTIKTDNSNFVKTSILKIMFRRNIRQYKKVKCFVKTPSAKKDLTKIGVLDSSIAPVGLDTDNIPLFAENRDSIRQKLSIPVSKTILLFVGRMEPYKRPLEAIELLKELNAAFLVMIGSGSLLEEVQTKVREYHIEDRVLFIDKVKNDAIHQYYYVSDYFINLNDHEIFGMSILEAMYQGCKVIAVKAPGPDFIIEHKLSGFLVDGLQEFNEIVKNNEELYTENIKNRILNNFTWNRTAKVICDWLEEKPTIGCKI